MHKGGYIYILTNYTRTTLYIGVTNDIARRILEHKNHIFHNSFTDKYNVELCIYYESFNTIEEAICREKEIKKWSRQKKENLINSLNPEWKEIDIGYVDVSN
ncbi:MAG: GIY-YIG nuclease family protein [Paludibacteraceae bacterium]|nr:GIY-YIG nuclease family protein [Paludibacteraceae bacterium]